MSEILQHPASEELYPLHDVMPSTTILDASVRPTKGRRRDTWPVDERRRDRGTAYSVLLKLLGMQQTLVESTKGPDIVK